MTPPPIEGVKTIQRVYQISPTVSAMATLLGEGLKSAKAVCQFDQASFVDHFAGKFSSELEAKQVYQLAEQAHAIAFGAYTTAQTLNNSVPLYAVSGSGDGLEQAKSDVLKHYPTMEELFGSLDFCTCEHCRSVLSPAAYLVDLLQFLNIDPTVWAAFELKWNKDTSHQTKFGPNDGDYRMPFAELDARRPDIKHLPLTCENTNTALPYIDVVNEILEYYVVHNSLTGDTGHDTGSATTQELLAEPQYVEDDAYARLAKELYPIGLPFDLPLNTVRGFLDYFGTPLADVLDRFRTADDLFASSTSASGSHFRSHVFIESLGLSQREWRIFSSPDVAAKWWTLYGYDADVTAKVTAFQELPKAATLADRLGVSYEELISLVESTFVNPEISALETLTQIGLDIGDVYRYENPAHPMSAAEQDAFVGTLQAAEAQEWLAARWHAKTFDDIVVLADPSAACNFEHTYFQKANGLPATDLDFLKLNLFVRLWRKLGWTIDETDRCLTALWRPGPGAPTTDSVATSFGTAVVYLAHLNALVQRLPFGRGARQKAATLWADIPTTGTNSLYAQLFLSRGALRADPAFDDALGAYLSTGADLADHRAGLQAALKMTAQDIDLVAESAMSPSTSAPAKLTIENVSILHRHALFARALKLSVRELIMLKSLSGLDPFTPLHAGPVSYDPSATVSPLSDDVPFAKTIAFADAAAAIAATGLSVGEVSYLLTHDPEQVARFRPDGVPALALARELAATIADIQRDTAVPGDLSGLHLEKLRDKLALVLPADATETFMSMMLGTVRYTAIAKGVAAADALDQSDLDASLITVEYRAAALEQRLTFTGVLTTAQKTAILSAYAAAGKLTVVLEAQLVDISNQIDAFCSTYLADFVAASDHAMLFAAPVAGNPPLSDEAAKVDILVPAFFPYLQTRLIHQAITAKLASTLDADPALVASLVTDAALLHVPRAAGVPPMPLLADFAAIAESGVTATFMPDATSFTYDTADTVSNDTPASGTATFEGYVQVPVSGSYLFSIERDQAGTPGVFELAHLPGPLIPAPLTGASSASVALQAGIPYKFSFRISDLTQGHARVTVQGDSLPKGPLSQLRLYPQTVIERIRQADVLLAKTLRLAEAFGLDERELRHLSFHGIDFCSLPTTSTAGAPHPPFAQFLSLIDYAAIRHDLGVSGNELVEIFEKAGGDSSGAADKAFFASLASLMRHDTAAVQDLCTRLALTSPAATTTAPGLDNAAGLRRLFDALQVVKRLGVRPADIVSWLEIVSPAPSDPGAIASHLKSTVRAHFEDETWYQVAQPIFNKLRQKKRDALVAYILNKNTELQTRDQLYEYFLVDPGMEPVMQTSRIQLAISSLQLFVQRCLLNLEPRVPPPAIIGATHWEWMKLYGIWEADRKFFLYPENWLEPEFRDDKTFLFTQLEGTLLQGEVSNDAAETAFLGYLQGLEGIARLEIVSMYTEEPDDGIPVYHVFGRTFGAPHKYFYRRYTNSAWTAWEPVGVDIEGDHVLAVKWCDRIHLFWLTFLERADQKNKALTPKAAADEAGSALVQHKVDVRINWSALVDGQWTPRSMGGSSSTIQRDVSGAFRQSQATIYVSKETRPDGSDGAVLIHIGGEIDSAFRIATRNSAPVPIYPNPIPNEPPVYYDLDADGSETLNREPTRRVAHTGAANPHPALWVNDLSQFDDSNDPVYGPPPQTILDTSPYGTYRLLFSDNRLASAPSSTAPLRGPFFYEDNCHTFFVRPRLTEKAISEFTGWAYEDIEPRAKVGPLTPVLAEAPQIEIHGSAIYALQESAALATQGRG